MKKQLYAFFIIASLCASENSRKQYLELIDQYPKLISPQGESAKGEIQIVTDKEEMKQIEQAMGRDVGLIWKDKYWMWVNDACIFPNGKKGVYGRVMWVKSLEGTPGVAVMPITCDEKVVVNCNYRHATRSWEIELPRGVINPHEDVESAAKREAMEETGMELASLIQLGEIAPDSGLTNSVIPIYAAKVKAKHEAEREDKEAIEDVLYLSIPELKQALLKGYYEHKIRGSLKQIPVRDPFLTYAILLYEMKQNQF